MMASCHLGNIVEAVMKTGPDGRIYVAATTVKNSTHLHYLTFDPRTNAWCTRDSIGWGMGLLEDPHKIAEDALLGP